MYSYLGKSVLVEVLDQILGKNFLLLDVKLVHHVLVLKQYPIDAVFNIVEFSDVLNQCLENVLMVNYWLILHLSFFLLVILKIAGSVQSIISLSDVSAFLYIFKEFLLVRGKK
jgi:hypothetical protein